MGSKQRLLNQLLRNKYQPSSTIRGILAKGKEKRQQLQHHHGSSNSVVKKGVYRGNYFRISIPREEPVEARPGIFPNIPKLPVVSQNSPVPLSSPPPVTATVTKAAPSTTAEATATKVSSGQASAASSSNTASAASVAAKQQQQERQRQRQEFRSRLHAWWQENWPVLVLNFGSICSLIGFTRSDVLELRALSVTGSASYVIYHLTQGPIRWTPVLWSMLFAVVNLQKIYDIIVERQGSVHLTREQEDMYSEFFMPHGITPKQFTLLYEKATLMEIPKGHVLIRKGEVHKDIYLIVKGSTVASILGRHLTAASMAPESNRERQGGAAGAWVGEMAFLEGCWMKDLRGKAAAAAAAAGTGATSSLSTKPTGTMNVPTASANSAQEAESATAPKAGASSAASDREISSTAPVAADSLSVTKTDTNTTDMTNNAKEEKQNHGTQQQQQHQQQLSRASIAMYTILAKEDCKVLRWSHDDMLSLMARSPDMHDALTRAMTSAIVGKVVNFTVSRSKFIEAQDIAHNNRINRRGQSWHSWLGDAWKRTPTDNSIAVHEFHNKSLVGNRDTTSKSQSDKDGEGALPTFPMREFK